MEPPLIETPRLRLRGYRAADLAARAAIGADPEVTRFLGGPQGREASWHRLQRYAGHWALLDHGLFALEERATGRMIGEVGIARFERGLGADFDDAGEAAWILAREAAGRGLAEEGMRGAIAWYEDRFGPARLVCLIGTGNTRSLRLAERLGFQPFREASYHDGSVILLERPPLAAGPEAR